MFEFKCISRQAFEENPHYVVFFEDKPVVTIWQAVSSDRQREIWCFVGSSDFLHCSEEFDTVQEALEFIKQNWTPESALSKG